jgi:3-oxoacyl-[acyl-carrier protein] reductase
MEIADQLERPQVTVSNGRAAARRVVLVTGASRGIGAAIASQLSARGCQVAIGYQSSRERAEVLAEQLGNDSFSVRYDLGDESAVDTCFQDVVHTAGGLDSVVLNAGVWDGGRLTELPRDRWWHVVETNLRGLAETCRQAVPLLSGRPNASIVAVSSVVGLIGHYGDTAYATAKSAMVGFVRSLAKEVAGQGIRVNMLAPGFVRTDMTAQVGAKSAARIEQATLLNRFGEADEIARAAVFLGEDATYSTGSVLVADGGWSV